MKIRRKVNNVGQWMKMEVPKIILKVGQFIDDLNYEVEIWNSKIKMNMIWNMSSFPIFDFLGFTFHTFLNPSIGQLLQAQMIKWSPSNLIQLKRITSK